MTQTPSNIIWVLYGLLTFNLISVFQYYPIANKLHYQVTKMTSACHIFEKRIAVRHKCFFLSNNIFQKNND